jgi:hypothetical protein
VKRKRKIIIGTRTVTRTTQTKTGTGIEIIERIKTTIRTRIWTTGTTAGVRAIAGTRTTSIM